MDRYLCIHAHFYQPPRENPWLEAVERQDSAYPFHDWNERITAECYEPMGASRILDATGKIQQIVNNYSHISFNFGPTLLSWMQGNAPAAYKCIIASDQEGRKRFSGHGPALAQAYNHMILPLGNQRDKFTQVLWGIRDFEHRFGRAPEGMWLPETAVDLATLEVLADLGIKFTVLAPRQAAKVRKIGGRSWKDVSGGKIDPTRAYLIKLPSGNRISLFFYDGPISQGVAFEGLLNNGQQFADRLKGGFSDKRQWPQLMHIATDGETYGHHHKYGDMGLTYALQTIEAEGDVRLTNYGEFLANFPPTHEVQIAERTSWSCSHGVDRWAADCGCNSGRPGWDQRWRAPLRTALDYLRDQAAEIFEERGAELLHDPWEARDDYIDVVLDRSPESLWVFFEKHSRRQLRPEETVCALKLLEMQRHAMLMYTSCGWFFDEISGIETVQVIQYAGRVVQLAREVGGQDPEPQFVELLARARSNMPEFGDGANIYQTWVKPAAVDLCKVGAHVAISSMFEGSRDVRQFCYDITAFEEQMLESDGARAAVGRARVTSRITRESRELMMAVVHMGDQVLNAGVRDFRGQQEYSRLVSEVSAAMSSGNFADVLRELDQHFGEMVYSLKSLFKDEQKRILDIILNKALRDAEGRYYSVYRDHGALLRFMRDMGQPVPEVLRITAEFVLNSDLKRAFQGESVDVVRVAMLMEMVKREGVRLDEAGLGYAASNALTRSLRELQNAPHDQQLLEQANLLMTGLGTLPFTVNYWHAQNIYYSILTKEFPRLSSRNPKWTDRFLELGEQLQISVPVPDRELRLAS